LRVAERAASSGLIWLPQGTCSQQAPQQAFIEALHQTRKRSSART